jgi:hypothetical protein
MDEGSRDNRPLHSWTAAELEHAWTQIRRVNDEIDQSYGDAIEHARELGARGWTVPVLQRPIFASAVLAYVPPEETDDFMVAFYTISGGRALDELTSSILSCVGLTQWHPLLEQAIDAHARGAFLITVPSLLTVFEGSLAVAVDQPNAARPRKLATERLESSARNLERLAWASIDAFTASVFQSTSFGTNRPRLLNRHLVLHGRDQAQWTSADSLRLLHAIHTVGMSSGISRRSADEAVRSSLLRQVMFEYREQTRRSTDAP